MATLDIDVLSPEVYAKGDPDRNGLPYAEYALLREKAPCYRHALHDPMMVDRLWVVTRHEDVWRVDRDADDFSSRSGITARIFSPEQVDIGGKPMMIGLDGQAHRRNRRVVSKAFTPRVVQSFQDHFREVSRRLVRNALTKGTFDFVPEISVEMPLTAICDLVGIPVKDRAKFLAWVNAFVVPTDPNYAPSPEAAMAAVASIFEYALELAEHRRQEPGDDLMSLIVAAREDETFNDDELQGLILLLAGGGADTTRNAFSHGLHALLRHPEQMEWLRQQADAIPATAVHEIVRWSTPVIHMARTATKDTEIAGQSIMKGDRVAMLFASANNDPAAISNPETFDLSRTPNHHVSFGVGPHACLGKHIAVLEITILFEELLQATSKIELAGPIGYTRDNFMRGVHTLPVTMNPA